MPRAFVSKNAAHMPHFREFAREKAVEEAFARREADEARRREFEAKERSLQRPTSRGTVSFSPEVDRDAAPEFYWRSRRAAEGDVPVPKPPGRGLCVAKARRAFEAESEQELPLADGDRVLIRYAEHHPSPGWIFAAVRGKAGYVPRNYLVIVDDAMLSRMVTGPESMVPPLSLSVVTFIAFTSSRFLIHCEPWPCGSTSTGYRVARVVMMPFWTESSSVGRPCRVHSPISESSTRNLATSRSAVTGMPLLFKSP